MSDETMKTSLISFNDDMINAIQSGRKTQTRLPVEPQPVEIGWKKPYDGWFATYEPERQGREFHRVKCPYGQPGDSLRVRDQDITLKLTSVRVERVGDISEEDAQAEGFPGVAFGAGPDGAEGVLPSDEFASAWDRIYEARGLGWDANPWVWVIGFVRED